MKVALYRAKLRAQRAAKGLVGKIVGPVAIGALHLARKFDPDKSARLFGAVALMLVAVRRLLALVQVRPLLASKLLPVLYWI